MALFQSSKDLFELISKPEGSSTAVMDDDPEAIFTIGGRPLVIVDDLEGIEPMPVAEDALEVTLRKDTMGVIAIVVSVLLAVSFLAGRATVRSTKADAKAATIPSLPEGVFDPSAETQPSPVTRQPAPQPVQRQPAAPAPRPAITPVVPKPATATRNAAADSTHTLMVCSTSREKAAKVVAFLNEDPKSPIAKRLDLVAFSKGGSVRIKGFKGEDSKVEKAVEGMKDPTGGGSFGSAMFVRSRR